MSGRAVVAVAVALLLAVPVLAGDKAQSRSGSSSSSKSGSTSSKSSSGSSSSSSTKSSSSRSSSTKSGGSRAAHAPATGAQRRHPRPGTGSGRPDLPYGTDFYTNAYSVKNLLANPYSYYPRPGYGYGYGYGPYRNGYGYGYGYGYGSGWGRAGYAPFSTSPYPGYSGVSEIEEPEEEEMEEAEEEEEEELTSVGVGMMRILVQPEKARVFVDGFYVGLVDDFDGLLQRLSVKAGLHEISLRLDGYRTQNFMVNVPEDGTIKVEHKMVRGSSQTPMETYAGRPVGVARMQGGEGTLGTAPPAAPVAGPVADTGMLRLGVRPHDASIYVDGSFRGTGSTVSALRLAPGRHRLEIVKPGHRTEERDVDVEAGETTEIDVELDRN